MKKNGIELISTKENIANDESTIFIESIIEGIKEYYSVELGQKIKEGKARKKNEREKIANEG